MVIIDLQSVPFHSQQIPAGHSVSEPLTFNQCLKNKNFCWSGTAKKIRISVELEQPGTTHTHSVCGNVNSGESDILGHSPASCVLCDCQLDVHHDCLVYGLKKRISCWEFMRFTAQPFTTMTTPK